MLELLPVSLSSQEPITPRSPNSTSTTTTTKTSTSKPTSPQTPLPTSTFPYQSPSPAPSPPPFTILPVRTTADLTAVTTLITAYAAALPIDISFQNFTSELATLPGAYAPQAQGELLLARTNNTEEGSGDAIGCIALRALSPKFPSTPNIPGAAPEQQPKTCELKRLYVSPSARGLGVGKALVIEILNVAKAFRYQEVKLDTLPSMGGASKIYEELGFADVEAYYETPVVGTRFLSLRL